LLNNEEEKKAEDGERQMFEYKSSDDKPNKLKGKGMEFDDGPSPVVIGGDGNQAQNGFMMAQRLS
jgi:hypothetical protein